MRAWWSIILGAWLAAAVAAAGADAATAAPAPGPEAPASAAAAPPVLKHSDVAFMYAADEASYKAYGATFVAWGGANTAAEVKRHRDLGIRCTGSMWCLTAGAENLAKDPALHDAVAKDIEGKPIAVPWLFDHVYQGQKTWFGCTNHPAFRAHAEREVQRTMAGGADGLHVDDHLGVAQAATAFGGGLCDHCIAAFREYLKEHATPEDLAKAGAGDLATFDFRDLIRKQATTRQEYMKVRGRIPLMDHFDRFHLEAAAAFVGHLREVAARAAGHPVLLSANAWIVEERHRAVAKYLTHVVCEAEFHAEKGTADLSRALPNFEVGRTLGKPVVVSASGQDYAFVKANKTEDLVRFWIALTYAHGQWFMVPHPQRQWCFTNELGTHWYAAPVEAYAPLYRFIRAQAEWFDGFEPADVGPIEAPATVLVTARQKGPGGPIVLHVVNRDYDAQARKIRPAKDVTLTGPAILAGAKRLLSYDAEPQTPEVSTEGDRARITLPELRAWTLVVIE
ncbi:MAG: hypothetical protein IMZ66_10650 [Planctomycetes bacterium]|nr:hypothetical protein [Planctomycetota bacterium]